MPQSRTTRHLVLVGMMGSGKSSVGRALAARSGAPYIDTDAAIEGRMRKTVSALFAEWGEARFREFEREVLAGVLADERPAILSTGGGVVVLPENRAALRASGYIVYLRASPEVLYQRLKRDTSRPLLQKPDPLQVLRDLETARKAYYEEADTIVDVSTMRPRVVAEEIWKRIPESVRCGLESRLEREPGRTSPP
ncbi:MAG: shikimate kinase [Candidatus Methylacidiphilales bacterium]|nr:shikimate kinase [Candidatus Methylacidiphilales bacterium]